MVEPDVERHLAVVLERRTPRSRLDTVAPMLIAATAVAIVVLAGAPFLFRLGPGPGSSPSATTLTGVWH